MLALCPLSVMVRDAPSRRERLLLGLLALAVFIVAVAQLATDFIDEALGYA